MHQPLDQLATGGHLRGLSEAAFLPHDQDCFLPEAFEHHDDALCLPRQMAVLLHKTLGKMCDEFSEILEEGWQDKGVRPE